MPQHRSTRLTSATPTSNSSVVEEKLFPIYTLGKRPWMPDKNGGKGLSRFTVLRWCLHGKSGVKLRSLMVGGIRCTTDAWARDFFEEVTRACDASAAKTGYRKVDASDHARAERELEAAGI